MVFFATRFALEKQPPDLLYKESCSWKCRKIRHALAPQWYKSTKMIYFCAGNIWYLEWNRFHCHRKLQESCILFSYFFGNIFVGCASGILKISNDRLSKLGMKRRFECTYIWFMIYFLWEDLMGEKYFGVSVCVLSSLSC